MKSYDGYKKKLLDNTYVHLTDGSHKPLSDFWTTSNSLGSYLPLTGGTIKNSNWDVLHINSTNSTESGVGIYRNDVYKGAFGYKDNTGTYMYNAVRAKYLNYKDDGTLLFEGNTVIHSGNISSYAATETWVSQHYLPLSGGTLSQNGRNILILKNNNEENALIPFISFYDSDNSHACFIGGYNESNKYFAWLGCGSARLFLDSTGTVRIGTDATNYTAWHAGNFDPNDYVPKSGGTMTGTLTITKYGPTINNYVNKNWAYQSFESYNSDNSNLKNLYHIGTLYTRDTFEIRRNGCDTWAFSPTEFYGFTNNTYYLGTTTYRWANVYSTLGNFSSTVTGGMFHSNASVSSTDITVHPDATGIALETGNGDGNVSAWIWREKCSNNWGIFHDNNTNTIRFVGNDTVRVDIALESTSLKVGGTEVSLNGHTHSYLPLSGGTLSNSNWNLLDLNSTHASETGIRMLRSNSYKAAFGHLNNVGVYMYNAARAKYLAYGDNGTLTFEGQTVVHSGNIGDYGYATLTWVGNNYLPLTGGTLKSSSFNSLDLNSTHTTETGMRIFRNGTYAGCFGSISNDSTYMFNAIRSNYLKYHNDGTLKFEGNTVWHAGNDGSGSGLDADTVDGKHASSFSLDGHTHSYLPLSGGTLTSARRDILAIQNSDGDLIPYIIFYSSTGNYYCYAGGYKDSSKYFMWLGCSSSRLFLDSTAGSLRVGTDSTNYKVWHEGNDGSTSGLDADLLDGQHGSYYASAASLSNYLPLSGGTLTNSNFNLLDLNSTHSGETGIRIFRSGTYKACFGYKDGTGAYIFNMARMKYLAYNDDGTLKLEGNVVWHAGNLTPGNYVLKAGDTMSGPLNISTSRGNGTALITTENTSTAAGMWGLNLKHPNLLANQYIWNLFGKSNDTNNLGNIGFKFVSNGSGENAITFGFYNNDLLAYLKANGNFGIGVLPDYKLHVNGNAAATNFYTTSDKSKKQSISSFSEHIRKFQLKDTEKWHYGVIAQEVPEMFRDGEEGNMTVNYNSILSFYIGQLENRVKELEEKIKLLETK